MAVVASGEAILGELGGGIRRWELECRTMPLNVKQRCSSSLKQMKNRFDTVRQDFVKAKVPTVWQRAAQKEVSIPPPPPPTHTLVACRVVLYHMGSCLLLQDEVVRSRLLQADDSLRSTEESAINSKRMLAESEQIGLEVAVNLRSQRSQLENARDGVPRMLFANLSFLFQVCLSTICSRPLFC